MRKWHWSLVIGHWLLGAAAVAAGDAMQWTLWTADFARHTVSLRSMEAKGLAFVRPGESDQQLVSWESFLELDRPAPLPAGGEEYVLYLGNRDRVVGRPISLKDEQLAFNSAALGQISISIRQVCALSKGQTAPADLDVARQQDVVQLSNGDVLRGIVVAMDGEKLTVQSGGDQVIVAMDSAASILLASASAQDPGPAGGFRVKLNDGSWISALELGLSGQTLQLRLADNTVRTVDLGVVIGIEQVNGPVSWLSSRRPDQAVQIPYAGERPWPTMMDRNVLGQTIRLGDRSIARGIGVHAYSRLIYPLDGQFKAFRTQYAMDSDGRYADVTVRIKVDERVVHEVRNFKSGVLSPVAVLDITGGKALTLEVDYGEFGDVQDRFNWIESALLRQVPAAGTKN